MEQESVRDFLAVTPFRRPPERPVAFQRRFVAAAEAYAAHGVGALPTDASAVANAAKLFDERRRRYSFPDGRAAVTQPDK